MESTGGTTYALGMQLLAASEAPFASGVVNPTVLGHRAHPSTALVDMRYLGRDGVPETKGTVCAGERVNKGAGKLSMFHKVQMSTTSIVVAVHIFIND